MTEHAGIGRCRSPRRWLVWLLVLLILVGMIDRASAIQSPYKLNPWLDSGIAGLGSGLFLAGLFLSDRVDPVTALEYAALDRNDLFFVDRWLVYDYSAGWNICSDAVTIMSLLTPGFFLFPTDLRSAFTMLVVYYEALTLAHGVKDVLKYLIRRPRPYLYMENASPELLEDPDGVNSFPSGHSTLLFTTAAFTTSTFCALFPESRLKPVVLSTSFAWALVGASLRIISGEHFITDVLCGAAIGILSGWLMPRLHLGKGDAKPKKKIAVLPDVNGVAVQLIWQYR